VSGWVRVREMEESLHRQFRGQGFPEELIVHMQYWANDKEELRAFLGREWCGGRREDPLRWHISIVGQYSVPDWGQMSEAAHAIRPGVHFVVMVPPRSMWMNVHENALHLWETADDALVQEAKANAMAQQPTPGRRRNG